MSTEENKAIVRRWFEVLNEKRLDRADDHVAQDYLDHGALPGIGRNASRTIVRREDSGCSDGTRQPMDAPG